MKVLVTATNYSKYCKPGKKILQDAGVEIIENDKGRPYEKEELLKLVGDIDGVVVGVDTWNEEIFSNAPNLKVMARFGVGVDNIDIEAAKKHGIVVCNTPGINSTAVAEQAFSLMFSLLRMVPNLNNAVRRGEWPRYMFHEMSSRTVGLLGYGSIPRKVAERLYGFHPRIIAYDKYPNKEWLDKYGVELVTEDELLKQADIISVHLPAMEETYHYINEETISKMKDGVLIVNTARGTIVNEADVAKALESGKIAGFASDVFEHEPVTKDYPLFKYENYIATPHVSAETYENCEQTSIATAEAILAVFNGQEPKNKLC